jgi:hypothetical protein
MKFIIFPLQAFPAKAFIKLSCKPFPCFESKKQTAALANCNTSRLAFKRFTAAGTELYFMHFYAGFVDTNSDVAVCDATISPYGTYAGSIKIINLRLPIQDDSAVEQGRYGIITPYIKKLLAGNVLTVGKKPDMCI